MAHSEAASPVVGEGYISCMGRLMGPQETDSCEEDPCELSTGRWTDGTDRQFSLHLGKDILRAWWWAATCHISLSTLSLPLWTMMNKKKKVFMSFPNRKKQLLMSAASVMRLNLMLSTHESLYLWASIYYEESFKYRGSYPQTVGARWVFFMAGSDWSVSPQWLIQ